MKIIFDIPLIFPISRPIVLQIEGLGDKIFLQKRESFQHRYIY